MNSPPYEGGASWPGRRMLVGVREVGEAKIHLKPRRTQRSLVVHGVEKKPIPVPSLH